MDPDIGPRRRRLGGRIGCFLVPFGSIFAVVGGLGVWQLLAGGDITVNGRPGTPADAWMPGIFLVIGLAIAGLRHARTVDLDERVVETRVGWLLWTRTTRAEIGAWRAVELGRPERRGSGSGAHTAVPVRLRGDAGTHEVDAPRDEASARRLAEWIARGASVTMIDASSGEPVERAPERLDEPLLARVGEADLRAPEPLRNRMCVEEAARGIRIRMPPSSAVLLAPLVLIPLALPIGFWWFVWRPRLAQAAEASTSAWLFLYAPLVLMVGLPLVAMLLSALRRGSFGHWIEVDDAGIAMLGRRIPAERLEDLRLGDAGHVRCLRAISDDVELKLGAGLRPDELAWLRATILRALKGR